MVTSDMTPHKLLVMYFTPWVTEEVGDGKMTGFSIAPYEVEEHFHTFPIFLALVARNHCHWVFPIAMLLEGAVLNPPPLPFLLPIDVLTPYQTGYGKKLLPLTSPWGLLQVLLQSLPRPS